MAEPEFLFRCYSEPKLGVDVSGGAYAPEEVVELLPAAIISFGMVSPERDQEPATKSSPCR